MVELRDFIGLPDEEFRYRMFQEIARVLITDQPYPPTRIALKSNEHVQTVHSSLLLIDLQSAKAWKDDGRVKFQLRNEAGSWQSYTTEKDGIIHMLLPEGNYSLRVGAKLEKTFLMKKDMKHEIVLR